MVTSVFRWAVWGDNPALFEMLPHSINTFRRAFGSAAKYIVITDKPSDIRARLTYDVEVIAPNDEACTFGVRTAATWRKWCPNPRLAPQCAEFNVDADVFLVGDPTELKRFATNHNSKRFLIMQEAPGSGYYVGQFASRIFRGIPPVNTGLIGQRAGVDITDELASEFQWWLNNVPKTRRMFHDDQGAITAILARWYLFGQVELLSQDRYRIVTPMANSDLNTLNRVVAIHAASKKHPAFLKFRREITDYISHGDSSDTPPD